MSYNQREKIKKITEELTKEESRIFKIIKDADITLGFLIKTKILSKQKLFRAIKALKRKDLIRQRIIFVDVSNKPKEDRKPLEEDELEDLLNYIKKFSLDEKRPKMTPEIAERNYPIVEYFLTKRAKGIFL